MTKLPLLILFLPVLVARTNSSISFYLAAAPPSSRRRSSIPMPRWGHLPRTWSGCPCRRATVPGWRAIVRGMGCAHSRAILAALSPGADRAEYSDRPVGVPPSPMKPKRCEKKKIKVIRVKQNEQGQFSQLGEYKFENQIIWVKIPENTIWEKS